MNTPHANLSRTDKWRKQKAEPWTPQNHWHQRCRDQSSTTGIKSEPPVHNDIIINELLTWATDVTERSNFTVMPTSIQKLEKKIPRNFYCAKFLLRRGLYDFFERTPLLIHLYIINAPIISLYYRYWKLTLSQSLYTIESVSITIDLAQKRRTTCTQITGVG